MNIVSVTSLDRDLVLGAVDQLHGQGVDGVRDATAIFAANDHMALGVLRAMHEAGRDVPGEVSIVGFDDIPEAQFFTPPLTTVHQTSTTSVARA